MKIADFFKPATPAAPAATNPPASGAPANLGDQGATKDAQGNIPQGSGTPVNPLDAYKKMYEDANKSSDIVAPSFKLDPKVLSDVSKSMDFTRGVDPALMEKALGGDAKSLLEVMQNVSRNTYSASLEHATALTDTHLGQRAAFDSKKIDAGVRTQLTNNALSTAPNYDHPVVKAELNRVASMFAQSNPDASPQQIALAAQKHLQDLSAALTPQKTAEEQAVANGEMDWSSYLK